MFHCSLTGSKLMELLDMVRLNDEPDPRDPMYQVNLHAQRRAFSLPNYWKTVGGSVLILPRQTGKTYACVELAKRDPSIKLTYPSDYEDEVAMYPECAECENALINGLEGGKYDCGSLHLLIDEFTVIPPHKVDKILSYEWGKVSMVGSLWMDGSE